MNATITTPAVRSVARLVEAELRRLPANQQPDWHDDPQLSGAVATLRASAPLVEVDDVIALRSALAAVTRGEALVLQAGDCAEDPADAGAETLVRKIGFLHTVAGLLHLSSNLPVVRIGRIGGQYAKPRSASTELVGDLQLPVYRGHLVNDPTPTPGHRRADPNRLVAGYQAARTVHDILSLLGDGHGPGRIYSSHEALVLDYELPLVRDDERLGHVSTSGHLLWVGARTNSPTEAHVELLSKIGNPVASKVGPEMSDEALVDLCAALDPYREPGRLTLISRMGADRVAERLPGMIDAVRRAGHAPVWLCDPMHANTVRTSGGLKTRLLPAIQAETVAFVAACRASGVHPGGLHLEATGSAVVECLDNDAMAPRMLSTTLCDPRLNLDQSISVIETFAGALDV